MYKRWRKTNVPGKGHIIAAINPQTGHVVTGNTIKTAVLAATAEGEAKTLHFLPLRYFAPRS